MTMAAQVHVVSKQDISNHTTLESSPDQSPLASGSVRVRSKLISITLNNRSYARLGSFLKWWDTYPVPPSLPEPYNDSEQWGIVPSWGYGEVIESKNPEIPVGTLLFGFWPTSSLPVDLQLKPADTAGHFTEMSGHRQSLMTLYNHYQVVDGQRPEELRAWESTVLVVWTAGYFLAKYCFPTGQGSPIHPFGEGSWTEREADLTSTLVVSLAASSKTARGLSWGLTQRDSGNAPLAVLEATSNPDALQSSSKAFETKTVSYDDLTSTATFEWIAKLRPHRIVITDCGAPSGVAQRFHDAVLASSTAAPSAVDYISIGAGPDALSTTDPRSRKLMLNTSPLMDAAICSSGLDSVYGASSAAFKQWLDAKEMGNLSLQWGSGVKGQEGVEGAWEAMMKGDLPRDKALVYRIV